ncbi:MAG: Gfo/Idh/MocA family oxidoreductase [Candidatus Omnitrophica bacterium]|nr:Gfo/Idh/MocA family oxidoreductase [Candidatus Omnitrophota bacterium]
MKQKSQTETTQLESSASRRDFMKVGGALAAGYALGNANLPRAFAGEDNTIRLALIGAGGRGNGAVANAFNTRDQGPIKLYAIADLHEKKIEDSLKALKEVDEDSIDVTPDRQFLGFEAYKSAIDTLRPGDVALCTTRAYIRPVHVEYAVQKGINVFMEKPFAPDPTGLHRMLKAGEEADKKGVKIAAGLQCRHSPARAALIQKIKEGEMGEISYIRANRLTSRSWMPNQREKSNDFIEQLQFGRVGLLWVGSGHMVDNLIHQIDECCWLMDSWPVSCHGMGGREVGSDDHGQNIDTYSMEFTFANGKKAFCGFRRAEGGHNEFATFVHGTERAGQFSGNIHAATVHLFKDHRIAEDNIAWSPTPDAHNPWDYEWIDFIDSIRNDKPHNETQRAVYSDYASLMGRAAAHTNQIVTWDDVISSKFEFCNYLDDLDYDSPPPVKAEDEGYFPAPVAGEWKEL